MQFLALLGKMDKEQNQHLNICCSIRPPTYLPSAWSLIWIIFLGLGGFCLRHNLLRVLLCRLRPALAVLYAHHVGSHDGSGYTSSQDLVRNIITAVKMAFQKAIMLYISLLSLVMAISARIGKFVLKLCVKKKENN